MSNVGTILEEYRDLKSPNKHYKTIYYKVLCVCKDVFSVQKHKYNNGKVLCNKCTRKVNLEGQKFGQLLVVESLGSDGKNGWHLCLCSCGNYTKVMTRNIKVIKSCGCLSQKTRFAKGSNTTHGLSHTDLYKIWSGMIQRTTNPKNSRYSDYGGRGVGVCEKWLKFEGFYEDMGDRPEGMTLDRIDNNLGYSKDNCKWSTLSEQQSNRRPTKGSNTRLGVSFCSQTNTWKARISVNKKDIWLGRHEEYEEACRAVELAEVKYLGYTRTHYHIDTEVVGD